MDVVLEFFLEFFITVWFELAWKIIPENKRNSQKVKFIIRLVMVFMILYVMIAWTVGAIILSDGTGSKALGIVLVSSATVIFLLQIVLGTIFYVKRR